MSDLRYSGTPWAINVPGFAPKWSLTMAEAAQVARTTRWIYANASLKDLEEGLEEAQKLSDAVGRPLVLIYLSRHIFDGQRGGEVLRFQFTLRYLAERALENGQELLVCARSYGVHQALRALRSFDSPQVLLLGIAPAFGWLGTSLTSNVQQYIQDVAETRCRYGMIASEDDGFTWRSGGAAYPDSEHAGEYRGDNHVGRAMSRNPENVTIVVLSGADHAPIDEYLEHGLVDAMQQVVGHFGMQDTPVGDVVYGRKAHSLRIVVEGLRGKGTFVARGEGPQQLRFHVEDLTSRWAEVQVFVEGVMRRQYRLEEGEDATFSFTGRPRQVRFLASSRLQRGAMVVHLDYEPPTFDGIQVSPSPRHPGGVILSAEGVRDDGNWNTSDYQVHATLDGRALSPRPGISVEVENLPPGPHTATLRVHDGAGRPSEPRTVQFVADSRPPQLEFVSPGANAAVQRGSELEITLEAGAPEGIMRASVYLDRVSDDEFDDARLWVFPGPFGAGSPDRRTCRVPANWSRGRHMLIAVAVDNAGQQTQVDRTFGVR